MLAGNEGNAEALKLLLDYGVDTEDRTVQWHPFDGDEEDPYASEGTGLYRACRQGTWSACDCSWSEARMCKPKKMEGHLA
jgi:hypothetical protein